MCYFKVCHFVADDWSTWLEIKSSLSFRLQFRVFQVLAWFLSFIRKCAPYLRMWSRHYRFLSVILSKFKLDQSEEYSFPSYEFSINSYVLMKAHKLSMLGVFACSGPSFVSQTWKTCRTTGEQTTQTKETQGCCIHFLQKWQRYWKLALKEQQSAHQKMPWFSLDKSSWNFKLRCEGR